MDGLATRKLSLDLGPNFPILIWTYSGEIGKVPIFPVTRLSPLSRRLAIYP